MKIIALVLIFQQDYWSTSLSKPPKDPKQSFFLTKANEKDGRTMVEFYRDAETGDTANDVQFQVRFFARQCRL